MIHSIKIGDIINARLTQDSALTEMTGEDKVFPIVAENGTEYPFIVYVRTGVSPSTFTKDGHFEDIVTFQVSVASDSYNESIEVADKVRSLLEIRTVSNGEITATEMYMTSISERFESETYIQQMQFTCRVHNC